MMDALSAGLRASLSEKYLLSSSPNTCLDAGGAQGSQNKFGQVKVGEAGTSHQNRVRVAEKESLLDIFLTDVLANDFNRKIYQTRVKNL